MSRLVLLIDSDVTFEHTLRQQLSQFNVAVEVAPDAEAIDALNRGKPSLVLIAVEEPAKIGYALCNKVKKGPTAHIPVMLITNTVPEADFGKHQKLKAHADAYLDKRTMTVSELLGKIDNLIELGEASVLEDFSMDEVIDDSPIPIEIDGGDFETSDLVDAASESTASNEDLDKETDDAFAALTDGLFDDIQMPANPTPGPGPSWSETASAGERGLSEPSAIPQEISYNARPFDSEGLALSADLGIEIAEPIDFEEEAPLETLDDQDLKEAPLLDINDQSAIDDSDSDVAFTGHPTQVERPMEIAAPVTGPRRSKDSDRPRTKPATSQPLLVSRQDNALSALPRRNTGISQAPPPSVSQHEEPANVTPSVPPSGIPRISDRLNQNSLNPGRGRPTSSSPIRRREPSIAPMVEQGLEKIAEFADREQSQVSDRRASLRSHELELRNKQLEADLANALSSADQAKTAERDLVRVRQELAAKELEATSVRDRLAQASKHITEMESRASISEHARQAAEAKNSQLETRLFEVTENIKVSSVSAHKVTELEQQIKTLTVSLQNSESIQTAAALQATLIEGQLAEAQLARSDAFSTLQIRHEQELEALQIQLAEERVAAIAHRQQGAEERNAARQREMEDAQQQLTAIKVDYQSQLDDLQQQASRLQAELHTAQQNVAAQSERAGRATAIASADQNTLREQLQSEVAEHQRRCVVAEQTAATAQESIATLQSTNTLLTESLKSTEAQWQNQFAQEQAVHAVALDQVARQHEDALLQLRGSAQAAEAMMLTQHLAEIEQQRQQSQQELVERQTLVGAAQQQSILLQESQAAQQALTADVQRLQSELATANESNAAKLLANNESHRVALELQTAEYDDTLTSAQSLHSTEVSSLQQDVSEAIQRCDVQSALKDALQRKLDDATAAHTFRLDQISAQQGILQQEHQIALANLQQQHQIDTKSTQSLHQAALATASATLAARDAEYASLETALAASKQAQLNMQTRYDALATELQQSAIQHQEQSNRITSEHTTELNILRVTAQKDIKELQAALSSARDTHRELEQSMTALEAQVAERLRSETQMQNAVQQRDQRLTELRADIASIEQENVGYQDQIVKAYQKIKSDEALVNRAKKAMAIALTVLDETGKSS